jgi:hypothetical protein
MRHPQIVCYESSGWLAGQVRRLALESGWLIREPRDDAACLGLLDSMRPSVLLLEMSRDPFPTLAFLAEFTQIAPDCPVVLISDGKMEGADHRAHVSALAFDLGARYVLFPPLQQPVIEDLVFGFLTASIKRMNPATADDHA